MPKALPVIDEKGVLLAMVSVGHLRSVPSKEWRRMTVDDVMDRQVRTLCPEHSAADADGTFEQTPYDYIPVVNPRTYQLVGILSHSDIYRSLDTKPSRYAA